MSSQALPLPHGWEQKYDARSGKYYYINHAQRRTQWEDPRLNDPSIWTPGRVQILEQLKNIFISTPEPQIRHALLREGFDLDNAVEVLASAGHQQHRTRSRASSRPQLQQQQHPQQSPRHPQQSATPLKADHFQTLYLKNRFAGISETLIEEVLVSNRNDVAKAVEQLASMGYEDREEAEREALSRREAEVERTQRAEEEKQERKRTKIRLSAEFSTLSESQIDLALEGHNFVYMEARKTLQNLKIVEDFSKHYSELDRQLVFTVLKENGYDSLKSGRILDEKLETLKKERRKKAAPKKQSQPVPKPRIQKPGNIPEPASVSSKRPPTKISGEPQKPGKSLAKGPNRSFRKGPNKEFLLKEKSKAEGPNKENYKGANSNLVKGSTRLAG